MDGPLRYSDAVLDHYRNPRNVGEIQGSAAVAQAGDPATGDVLKISLRIQNGVVEEAARLTNLDVVRALGGLPDSKIECSVLAEQAIQAALRRHRETVEKERDEETARCRPSASP